MYAWLSCLMVAWWHSLSPVRFYRRFDVHWRSLLQSSPSLPYPSYFRCFFSRECHLYSIYTLWPSISCVHVSRQFTSVGRQSDKNSKLQFHPAFTATDLQYRGKCMNVIRIRSLWLYIFYYPPLFTSFSYCVWFLSDSLSQ